MAALAALLVLPALAGCDGQLEGDFEPKLVVSATLGAGEPLPAIFLAETSPLLETYDPEAVAVRGARVTVTLVAPDGADEATYVYEQNGAGYLPPRDRDLGRADRASRAGPTAWTRPQTGGRSGPSTTVPPLVDLVEGPQDRVVYGAGQGPELRIRQSSTVERRAAFVASTAALAAAEFARVTVEGEARFRSVPDAARFLPVPVYQRFLDCEPEPAGTILCGDDPTEARRGTSPVINEDSYVDVGGGVVLVRVPFLAFGYYGPYRITLTSLDAALQDFVQTQAIQGGGTTLSPGEIPNATSNVEGGIGVFGSYAQVSVETAIAQP